MPVQHGPATAGKKTHEDAASSKAKSQRGSVQAAVKPESRVGAKPVSSVSAAEKLVRGLGR